MSQGPFKLKPANLRPVGSSSSEEAAQQQAEAARRAEEQRAAEGLERGAILR